MIKETSATLIEELVDENCPVHELVRFSTDKRNLIREAVATNPNVPAELVNKMVPDANFMVCKALVLSGKVTTENLFILANYNLGAERQPELRGVIASQLNAPTEIVEWVVKKGSAAARSIMLRSVNVPANVLRALWVKAADYMKADAIKHRCDSLPMDLLFSVFFNVSSASFSNHSANPREFLLSNLKDKVFAHKFLLFALKAAGAEDDFSNVPLDWLVEIAKLEGIDIWPENEKPDVTF